LHLLIFATKTRRHEVSQRTICSKPLLSFYCNVKQKKFFTHFPEEEGIGNAAYRVDKKLGPGLLEKVYEVCFCFVLSRDG